jgi:hypothetical protein
LYLFSSQEKFIFNIIKEWWKKKKAQVGTAISNTSIILHIFFWVFIRNLLNFVVR